MILKKNLIYTEKMMSEEKVEFPEAPIRMSKEDKLKFIEDFFADKVFTNLAVPADDHTTLSLIFLPIGLGLFSSATEGYIQNIGILWEYVSAAAPRAVNGYPSFFSVRIMHIEDWIEVRDHIGREMEEREARKKVREAEMGES